MKFCEISVHCIARTGIDREAIGKWLETMGATQFEPPSPDVATDPEILVGLAAKRCYKSFEPGLNPNVTKVREDWAEYLDNILKSGHGSVIEHATWTWAIENCTRVFTAEMNRHRAGVAISEGSLRYIRFAEEGIPFWLPTSLRDDPMDEPSISRKKAQSRAIFEDTVSHIQTQYSRLVDLWDMDRLPFVIKKQITSMMRRIIPLGVCTGAVYTLNARALRHIMTMRCDPAAEEEIALVVSLIAKQMVESDPKLFGDFRRTPEGFWMPKYRKV